MKNLVFLLLAILPVAAFCQDDGEVQFNVKKVRDTVPYLSNVYACSVIKNVGFYIPVKIKAKKFTIGKRREREIAKAVVQFFPNGVCKVYCIDLNKKGEVIKQTEIKDFVYTLEDSTLSISQPSTGKSAGSNKLVFYGKKVNNRDIKLVNNNQFVSLFDNKNYIIADRYMVFTEYKLNN